MRGSAQRFAVLAAMLSCPELAAQAADVAPDPLTPVRSMGRPPVWKPFAGSYFGLDRSGEATLGGGGGYLGVYKDLMPSIVGIGLSGEGYLGGYTGGAELSGGVRGLLDLRGLFLKAGVDYDIQRQDTSFLLSLSLPLRRGGILGHGSHFRVDWLPGRGNSFAFGFQFPLEPHMGNTRPRDTEVDLPRAKRPAQGSVSPPAAQAAMREARLAAQRITILTSMFWNDDRSDRLKSLEKSRAQMLDFKKAINATTPLRPRGAHMDNEVRVLHDQLARAFGLAAGAGEAEAATAGAPLAALARDAVLDEVLYPYNRLFGQYKKPNTLWSFAPKAREAFRAKLAATPIAATQRAAVTEIFEDNLRLLEENRAWWLKQHENDGRLTWLPFQLAMLPEQHDSQEELDAILSRAQGTPLLPGNQVLYWNGQQWQGSLQRSLHAAEDYHVLWLHDIDGVDPGGGADVIGAYITIDGYLKALATRVREFDRTGKLPVFMILVDLNYWEGNRGRIYTDVLQDPLHTRPRVPNQEIARNREVQRDIEKAQGELRAAVAGSARLQAEAARRGQDWLRKYVAVHLNVMNPADFSFRTSRLIGYLPIAPDTIVRDHRKIVFFDVTEADPAKGAALFGGVGVGEQYASPTWEDRAVRLTGPAALSLKDATRRYLRQNGFKDADIPFPLLPLPKPPDYDERVRALEARGQTATAMQVHNDRGFVQKDASIASAVLYTLMPPKSLIVVPDSIWTHELWAAQLMGAALRGCHVYVISPAAANAPSAGFPQLSRTHEIFSRFVEAQRVLGPEIAERGGQLRVGLYTRRGGVNDIQAELAQMHETYERYPFLKEDFPFPPEFYARVPNAAEFLARTGYKPDDRLPEDAKTRSPKLHRKTQLFVTRDALRTLVQDPSAQEAIANLVKFNATHGVIFDPDELRKAGIDLGAMLRPYLDAYHHLRGAELRDAVLYMTVGSLNKDARGMMTDGEVLQVTSGAWAMWAIADMWALTGSTTWIETQEELDRLLPPYTQWQRRIGRWVRKVI